MRVVAIVLAAGASKRLGRPKQLVEYRGETLLARAVRIAREVADEVIAVVPPGFDGLVNAHAEEGMASSIRLGVEAAMGLGPSSAFGTFSPSRGRRFLFVLCDQPLVTAEHLRALVAVDAPIVASGYRGIAGVPAIFAPRFVPELLALRGDRGARAVIEAHRDETHVIVFEGAGTDVDTEDDSGRVTEN